MGRPIDLAIERLSAQFPHFAESRLGFLRPPDRLQRLTELAIDGRLLRIQFRGLLERRELSVRLRSAKARVELLRMGSLSHVFRKQGIHIIADPVTEVVADGAYFIEPDDKGMTYLISGCQSSGEATRRN